MLGGQLRGRGLGVFHRLELQLVLQLRGACHAPRTFLSVYQQLRQKAGFMFFQSNII